jgi:LAO/AO transport system kinase
VMEPADPDWRSPVVAVSGATGQGLDGLWETITRHRAQAEASGAFARRRAGQQVRWFDALVREGVLMQAFARSDVAARRARLRGEVEAGRLPASLAADDLLAEIADG